MFTSRRLPQNLVPAYSIYPYLWCCPWCNLREVNIPFQQISKSGAASGYGGPSWNVRLLELAGRIPEQDRRLEVAQPGMNLFHVIEHVALRYKQILPSVVIE